MNNKHCRKCDRIKPTTEFAKDKDKKDGFATVCKECRKAYRKANIQSIKANDAKYYQENKDRIEARKKQYRANNKEKIKRQKRKYYAKNQERMRAEKNKRFKKQSETLSDGYVRHIIKNSASWQFEINDVPDELVQATRLKIQFERKLKSLKK